MHERTNIQLNAIDRSALEAVVANRNSAQKHAWRAKIVLMTADGYGTAEIMRATGKAKKAETPRAALTLVAPSLVLLLVLWRPPRSLLLRPTS